MIDWRDNFICCPHIKKPKGLQKVYAHKLRACCRKCRKEGYLADGVMLDIKENTPGRFVGYFHKEKPVAD